MMRVIGDFYVAENAVITGQVSCGSGVNIWFGSILRGDLAKITLGPRVNLQDGCIVHTDTDKPQTVDEGVVVGHAVVLHGRHIGRDTLIGIGARLLSGCDIGEECLVAAGAVIPEGMQVPPGSVVMGVPGKIVRRITAEEVERTRRICTSYLALAQRYAKGEVSSPWPNEMNQ